MSGHLFRSKLHLQPSSISSVSHSIFHLCTLLLLHIPVLSKSAQRHHQLATCFSINRVWISLSFVSRFLRPSPAKDLLCCFLSRRGERGLQKHRKEIEKNQKSQNQKNPTCPSPYPNTPDCMEWRTEFVLYGTGSMLHYGLIPWLDGWKEQNIMIIAYIASYSGSNARIRPYPNPL